MFNRHRTLATLLVCPDVHKWRNLLSTLLLCSLALYQLIWQQNPVTIWKFSIMVFTSIRQISGQCTFFGVDGMRYIVPSVRSTACTCTAPLWAWGPPCDLRQPAVITLCQWTSWLARAWLDWDCAEVFWSVWLWVVVSSFECCGLICLTVIE